MSANFERAYFFGDSLSDTGNILSFTGGEFPSFPFATGRFSNGDVWVDYLAEELNLTIDPFTANTTHNDGLNYAVGGTTSGTEGAFPVNFGLQQQIDLFELQTQLNPADTLSDDLLFLWTGANDYFSFIADDPTTPDVVEAEFPQTGKERKNAVIEVVDINIGGAIQDLIDAGGENIVVFNLPSLEATPLGQGLDKKDRKQLEKLTNKHNKRLSSLVKKTEKLNPDVNIIEVDIDDLFEDILDRPDEFGLTDVTDNFTGIDLYTGINQPPAMGNPEDYLFFDSVHPTTNVHGLVADLVMNELTDEGLIMH